MMFFYLCLFKRPKLSFQSRIGIHYANLRGTDLVWFTRKFNAARIVREATRNKLRSIWVYAKVLLRARSRLYRGRFLQVNSHVGIFLRSTRFAYFYTPLISKCSKKQRRQPFRQNVCNLWSKLANIDFFRMKRRPKVSYIWADFFQISPTFDKIRQIRVNSFTRKSPARRK